MKVGEKDDWKDAKMVDVMDVKWVSIKAFPWAD